MSERRDEIRSITNKASHLESHRNGGNGSPSDVREASLVAWRYTVSSGVETNVPGSTRGQSWVRGPPVAICVVTSTWHMPVAKSMQRSSDSRQQVLAKYFMYDFTRAPRPTGLDQIGVENGGGIASPISATPRNPCKPLEVRDMRLTKHKMTKE